MLNCGKHHDCQFRPLRRSHAHLWKASSLSVSPVKEESRPTVESIITVSSACKGGVKLNCGKHHHCQFNLLRRSHAQLWKASSLSVLPVKDSRSTVESIITVSSAR